MKRYQSLLILLSLLAGTLLVGMGAGWTGTSPVSANLQETEPPTRTTTSTATPLPWTMYMSEVPGGEEKTVFTENTGTVWINTYASLVNERPELVHLEIVNRFGGVQFTTNLSVTQSGWLSPISWTPFAGRIPPQGSPYYTNLYRLSQGPQIWRQVEWAVGTSIAFDQDVYYTYEQAARVITFDALANPTGELSATLQVQVSSNSNPGGILVTLRETFRGSSRFISDPIFFSPTSSDPAIPRIQVLNNDTLTASYSTAEGTYTRQAVFIAGVSTVTPIPTITVGPSATPSPTPPIGSTVIALTPAPEMVGWIIANEPTKNHFGDVDMYTGIWGGFNIHHGAFQFDLSTLPAQARLTAATLLIVGKDDKWLQNYDDWNIQLLISSVDTFWASRSYNDLHPASVVSTTLVPVISSSSLGKNVTNSFTFGPADLLALQDRLHSTQKISFRVDGPDSGDNNVFIWHTGAGGDDPVFRPRLRLTYYEAPDTPTPTVTATATPSATPTATPTNTRTPSNTATQTQSPTMTFTPTVSPTPTITSTPKNTATSTVTQTPIPTLTLTATLDPGLARLCLAVYEDVNGNTMLDPGESYLAGAILTVISNADQSPVVNFLTNGLDEPRCFALSYLPGQNSYNIQATLAAGYRHTGAESVTRVLLAAGMTVLFGAQRLPTVTRTPTATATRTAAATPSATATPSTGAICGIGLFDDLNSDGFKQSNEFWLAGGIIQISGPVTRTYTTDGAHEPHCEVDLLPGHYVLTRQNPPGYVSTHADSRTADVEVQPNTQVLILPFGARLTVLPTFTASATVVQTSTPTSTVTATPSSIPSASNTATTVPGRTPSSTNSATATTVTATASPTEGGPKFFVFLPGAVKNATLSVENP
ncbi:MAG: hypothetical protein EXR62_04240 [Chloroflexi bacterium]|nr:hypothetical protein [Chloroflexota bacterium]